ncbi:hypothetical protein [Sphingobacterium sp.]|uniref:hypothetical protein n=1 Tax=Sphingobacterium sp. TaxID=341027 RepID=UPI00289C767E|nr:hypothetical protein [Sphingobacterium sp.]
MDEKQIENYASSHYARSYDSLIRLRDYNYKVAIPFGGIGAHNQEMNTVVRYESGDALELTPASLLLHIILIIYFSVKIIKNLFELKNKPKYEG